MHVTARSANEDDLDVYRSLRLASLAESPSAFGASLAEELAFDDAAWLKRIREDKVILCFADDAPAGLAKVSVRDGECFIKSVWVSPEFRGKKLSDIVMGTAIGWAITSGLDEVLLWVNRDNPHAIGLYERHGFVADESRSTEYPEWLIMAKSFRF